MKTFICFLLFLTCSAALADDSDHIYINVGQANVKKSLIAVTPFLLLSSASEGSKPKEVGTELFNTISNDVWEIYQVYGIEAARNCLIHEIVEVLEYNGTYISQRVH